MGSILYEEEVVLSNSSIILLIGSIIEFLLWHRLPFGIANNYCDILMVSPTVGKSSNSEANSML